MDRFKIKGGLAVASLLIGYSLENIPRIKESKHVKKIANKSKRYGLKNGRETVNKIVNDIDPELMNLVEEIPNIIKEVSESEIFNKEEYNKDNDIKVVFIDDEKEEKFLLPPHKKTS